MALTFVLSATGTDVGKTHLGEALIRALPDACSLSVWKPYESGLAPGHDADSQRLQRAVAARSQRALAPCRMIPPLAQFVLPLAPPLAAAREGSTLPSTTLRAQLLEIERSEQGIFLLELVGGLFAPICDDMLGVDVVRALSAPRVVVVAPNRLGVLHDVLATVRAASAAGIEVAQLVLSSCMQDASSADNAQALAALLAGPPYRWSAPPAAPLHVLPHASPEELATSAELRALIAALTK